MKKHAGYTLLQVMVVILLSAIPLAIVTQYTGVIVNLTAKERTFIDDQRGLMAAVYDLQRDVKSATYLEVTADTLSLISDDSYDKYTFENGALSRTTGAESSERLLSNLSEGYFVAVDSGVTIHCCLDGTAYTLTLYGEVVT